MREKETATDRVIIDRTQHQNSTEKNRTVKGSKSGHPPHYNKMKHATTTMTTTPPPPPPDQSPLSSSGSALPDSDSAAASVDPLSYDNELLRSIMHQRGNQYHPRTIDIKDVKQQPDMSIAKVRAALRRKREHFLPALLAQQQQKMQLHSQQQQQAAEDDGSRGGEEYQLRSSVVEGKKIVLPSNNNETRHRNQILRSPITSSSFASSPAASSSASRPPPPPPKEEGNNGSTTEVYNKHNSMCQSPPVEDKGDATHGLSLTVSGHTPAPDALWTPFRRPLPAQPQSKH